MNQHNATMAQIIEAGEIELSNLAYRWRSASDPERAEQLVHRYHEVVAQMQAAGWSGAGLSVDAHLPDELMPPFLRGC